MWTWKFPTVDKQRSDILHQLCGVVWLQTILKKLHILDVCARCFLISILCPPPVTPIKFGRGISSHSLSMHSKIDIQSAFSICPFPKYCQTSHFRSKYSKDHLLKRSNIKWREINRKKINKKKIKWGSLLKLNFSGLFDFWKF